MIVQKASVMGVCFGVENAIKIAIKAREETTLDRNVYLLGRLVHNQMIMDDLKKRGITVLDDNNSLETKISNLPSFSTIVFSAHGHDFKLDELAKKKNLKIYDASCPRVLANLQAIKNSLSMAHQVFYIGIASHPESDAALALSDKIIFIDYKVKKIPYFQFDEADIFNQTTLNKEELDTIYKLIANQVLKPHFYNDICDATFRRQKAIEEIDKDVESIIVLGDPSSSNSRRLLEVAKRDHLIPSYLVSNFDEVKLLPLEGIKKVFLTAGASTPSYLIDMVYEYLINLN